MGATDRKIFVIDFDSTFIQVEALEELALISLKRASEKEAIIEEIRTITNLGIEEKISFQKSLEKRIQLLKAHRDDLEVLVNRLKRKISASIKRNKDFFKQFTDQIYIISGGFKEFIDPIASMYKIPSKHVFANTFIFDDTGALVF